MTTDRTTAEDSIRAGANIIAAARVMRTAHEETSALFAHLDKLLLACDVKHAHLTSQHWVGLYQTGAKIGQPWNWLATMLQRAYLTASPTVAVVVAIDLNPEAYSEPTLSILAVRFESPISAAAIWRSWNWEHTGTWQNGEWGACEVDTEPLEPLFPGLRVVTARGYVQRLCCLNKSSLQSEVAQRALSMASSLDTPAENPG